MNCKKRPGLGLEDQTEGLLSPYLKQTVDMVMVAVLVECLYSIQRRGSGMENANKT